jgi:uncharacterized membrane protein YsdA (DUF1294 family)
MIQRIQTVFLLLAFVAIILLFHFPFAVSDVENAGFFSDSKYNVYDNVFLIVLVAIGSLLALAAIFLFKNRALQLRFSYLMIVQSILLVIVAAVLFYNEAKSVEMEGNVSDSVGLYLPIITIVLAILAGRYIARDEKTVRSMDRLR